MSFLALIQSEKTKQRIADSDSSKTWSAGCFYYAGVSCCLLTGLSVTPEAGRNVTAGTFTFQRHASRSIKVNSTERLNGHGWCLSFRQLEINRCRHSGFHRSLFAFVCRAPELHLTPNSTVGCASMKDRMEC